MRLSQYDRVVCLFVDRRHDRETDRVRDLLYSEGVRPSAYRAFVDGDGSFLPREWYNQVTHSTPSGWVHGKGAWAHFRAMQAVVREANDDGVDNLLWVEDDCIFREDFDEIVAAATTQLENLPAWDILCYGANHTWATTEELSPNVLRCHGSYTTHCMGIRRHMFDVVGNLPPIHVIDNVIANLLHPQFNCYAIWPNAAVQKPGYSFLSNCQMDYSGYFASKGANWT